MLGTVTTLIIQLLTTTVEAMTPEMVSKIEARETTESIRFNEVFFKFPWQVGDPEADIEKYIRNPLNRLFEKCDNNIPCTKRPNDKFKHIESFFEFFVNYERIVEILNSNEDISLINETSKNRYNRNIRANAEILKILLDKKAIPSVIVNGKLTVSFNGIFDYLFKSLFILVGEDNFTTSKNIKNAIIEVDKIRMAMDKILEEFYKEIQENPLIDKAKYQKQLKSLEVSIYKRLYELKTSAKLLTEVDKNNEADKTKQYLKFYKLTITFHHILAAVIGQMNSFEASVKKPKWANYDLIVTSFSTLMKHLVYFAIPEDKMDEILTAVEQNDEVSRFSIFGKNNDFVSAQDCKKFFDRLIKALENDSGDRIVIPAESETEEVPTEPLDGGDQGKNPNDNDQRKNPNGNDQGKNPNGNDQGKNPNGDPNSSKTNNLKDNAWYKSTGGLIGIGIAILSVLTILVGFIYYLRREK